MQDVRVEVDAIGPGNRAGDRVDLYCRKHHIVVDGCENPRQRVSEIEFANDNWVAATGIVTGTHLGEYLGLKSTGKKIRMRFSDFWSVRDGKLKDNWVMIDNVDVLNQLGVDLLSMVPRG